MRAYPRMIPALALFTFPRNIQNTQRSITLRPTKLTPRLNGTQLCPYEDGQAYAQARERELPGNVLCR